MVAYSMTKIRKELNKLYTEAERSKQIIKNIEMSLQEETNEKVIKRLEKELSMEKNALEGIEGNIEIFKDMKEEKMREDREEKTESLNNYKEDNTVSDTDNESLEIKDIEKEFIEKVAELTDKIKQLSREGKIDEVSEVIKKLAILTANNGQKASEISKYIDEAWKDESQEGSEKSSKKEKSKKKDNMTKTENHKKGKKVSKKEKKQKEKKKISSTKSGKDIGISADVQEVLSKYYVRSSKQTEEEKQIEKTLEEESFKEEEKPEVMFEAETQFEEVKDSIIVEEQKTETDKNRAENLISTSNKKEGILKKVFKSLFEKIRKMQDEVEQYSEEANEAEYYDEMDNEVEYDEEVQNENDLKSKIEEVPKEEDAKKYGDARDWLVFKKFEKNKGLPSSIKAIHPLTGERVWFCKDGTIMPDDGVHVPEDKMIDHNPWEVEPEDMGKDVPVTNPSEGTIIDDDLSK